MKKQLWSHDEISALCLKLALFLHAGVSVGGGLALLAEEAPAAEERHVLAEMAGKMDGGSMLGEAFRAAERFPDYVCGLIEVGERTGRTEDALRALARYYDRRAQMNRRLRTALVYPAVLLVVMLAVIFVLLTQVLPVFNSVYASLGGRMTGLAGGLLTLGWALDAAMPVLAVLLTLLVLVVGAFAGIPSFRTKLLTLWREKCGDKGVTGALARARFAQTLAMCLESGLTGEESMELAAVLLKEYPALARRCQSCEAKLKEGMALAKAIGGAQLLSPGDCRLLELGMRSGCQDEVVEQLAQRLDEESELALEERLGQIEPALILFASLLVGVILLAVMLPLMNIMTAIG